MIKHRAARILGRVTVYLIAAAALVWVFHDAEWAKLGKNIIGLNWWWAAAGIVFDTLSYVSHGYRWRLLLMPLGEISTLRTTQAVYSGLFINEVLPMHIGEIGRGYLVSRWMAKPIVAMIPSMALERLFDGIWLAAGLGLTAIFVPLPRKLLRAGDFFGLVILTLTGVVLYFTFRKRRQGSAARTGWVWGSKALSGLGRFLDRLEDGLRSIGFSRFSTAAFFVSLMLLGLQTVSFWFIMKAYGLGLPFWAGAAVCLIVHFGTVLPNTPGYLGIYQLFCVLGLTLFGVGKTAAAGFSIAAYVLLTIPLWVIGLLALGQSGTTLAAMRAKIKNLGVRA